MYAVNSMARLGYARGLLHAFVFVAGLCLASGPAGADAAAGESASPIRQGTMAQPLDRPLPRYPNLALQAGREGWVILSYVVQADGSVDDIIVDASSGGASFESAARRAVEQWTFEPARLDGKPTQQCHQRVVLPFVIDMPNDERGARHSYLKFHEKARRAQQKGDLDEARRLVAELRERPNLNLYEDARLWLLESTLDGQTGDEAGELRHLRNALRGKADYIEPEVRTAAVLRMFALEVKLGQYAEALGSFESMQEFLAEDEIPAPVARISQQITALASASQDISVPGRLGIADTQSSMRGVWTHTLFRRTIGFSSESLDQLEAFDLRCDFHRAMGKPKANRALRIPPEWGECRIYVFGEPGATFDLIEYGSGLSEG